MGEQDEEDEDKKKEPKIQWRWSSNRALKKDEKKKQKKGHEGGEDGDGAEETATKKKRTGWSGCRSCPYFTLTAFASHLGRAHCTGSVYGVHWSDTLITWLAKSVPRARVCRRTVSTGTVCGTKMVGNAFRVRITGSGFSMAGTTFRIEHARK